MLSILREENAFRLSHYLDLAPSSVYSWTGLWQEVLGIPSCSEFLIRLALNNWFCLARWRVWRSPDQFGQNRNALGKLISINQPSRVLDPSNTIETAKMPMSGPEEAQNQEVHLDNLFDDDVDAEMMDVDDPVKQEGQEAELMKTCLQKVALMLSVVTRSKQTIQIPT